MMKYKMHLKIPIYGWDLMIYRMKPEGRTHKIPEDLNGSLAEKELNDFNAAINSGGMFGFFFFSTFHRIADIVVCTDDFEGGDYINRLTHEINHLIDTIVDNHDINDTEARSYLTGWIYQNIREKGFI